jgi:hypothetical protein
MSKVVEAPPHALTVTEYQEFRRLVSAFAAEHYGLMAIVGPPGVAKSEIVTRTMQKIHGIGRWASIRGKHSSLDLYRRMYENRLHPIVLDDLDGLLADRNNTALLKAICDTKRVRRVEWGSYHSAFAGPFPLPKSFDAISTVAVIANDLTKLNKNIEAVLDRGLTICFRPSAVEIHREIASAGWFDDEEIFRFVGEHLHLLVSPSMRFYITAKQHKKAGMNWKELVLRTIESSTDAATLLVAKLLADPHFDRLSAPEAAREAAFFAQGGGSRATYHRRKQEVLTSRGAVDRDAVAAIRLGPAVIDPADIAMAEKAEFLESLRDSLRDHVDDESGSA